MAFEFHITDGWAEMLAAAGLDSFDAMLEFENEHRPSYHKHCQVYRIALTDGRAVYLKRDSYTLIKNIWDDIIQLSRPIAMGMHELEALKLAARAGVRVPEVIAWGYRNKGPLPYQSVLVMTELAGVPLHKLVQNQPPCQKRSEAFHAAGRTAAKLYAAGLSWPDLVPKHFYYDAENAKNGAGVLDLARMRQTRRPARWFLPKQVRKFRDRLKNWGGEPEDFNAFLKGLDRDDILNCSALTLKEW